MSDQIAAVTLAKQQKLIDKLIRERDIYLRDLAALRRTLGELRDTIARHDTGHGHPTGWIENR